MENGIVVLIDRLAKSFTMSQHLGLFVWLLWIQDIPAIEKLRDTVQIGQMRGRLLCTENLLVDS